MTETTNRFKNASGARYTRGLFYETTENRESAIYTLKEVDSYGLPSLKRLYIESEDVTEYDFATRYLDGYSHWKSLAETTWFAPIVADWREELKLKLKARYLKEIREIAKESGREKYIANKTLLESTEKALQRFKTLGRPRGSGKEVKPLESSLIEDTAITTNFDRIFNNGK